MSFVDLMGGDAWSEADIANRVETMIRASTSMVEESILNRKITGANLGLYTLTADDELEIQNYATVCLSAQTEGRTARVDAALLDQVLSAERAHARLALPALAPPDPTDAALDPSLQAAYDLDVSERAAAQAAVNAASPDVAALVTARAAANNPNTI